MKILSPIRVIVIAAAMLLMPAMSLALTGGPDGGGYTFDDSASPVFDDISPLLNAVGLLNENSQKQISIGFTFNYYGTDYTDLRVGSNGHIDFNAAALYGNTSFNEFDLPIPQRSSLSFADDNGWGVNPLIAVFFDDLDITANGDVYFYVKGTVPNRRLIIQWDNVPHAGCVGSLPTDNMTVQAILYETTNEIRLSYQDVATTCINISSGASATTGLAFNRYEGLEYSSNSAAYISGDSVLYIPSALPAEITPSAVNLDFGTIKTGTPVSQVLRMTNTGNQVLIINNIIAPALGDFSIISDGCTSVELTINDYCAITVVYDPVLDGVSATDTITVNSTDPVTPVLLIDLDGIGDSSMSGEGDISVTDSSGLASDLQADFGDVEIYNTVTHSFSVTNNGDTALSVTSIGDPGGAYSIVTDACSGQSLAQSASCDFDISFNATQRGLYRGVFDIVSDDPDTPNLSLFINASAYAAAVANITVSDSISPFDDYTVAFSNIPYGNTQLATLTVGNNGTAPLVVSGFNGPSTPFSIQSEDCQSAAVTVGGTCLITLAYSPVSAGLFIDTIGLISNDLDSPLDIALTGSAFTPLANITASDSSIDFGSLITGDTTTFILTVGNNGIAPLSVSGYNGPVAPFSVKTENCTLGPVAPGASCTIVLEYAPTVVGPYSDTFGILSNDSLNSPMSIPLSAIAVDAIDIVVTDSLLPDDDYVLKFTSTPIGSPTTATITVANAGTETLVVTDYNALAPPFFIQSENCKDVPIDTGQSCTFVIQYSPTVDGTFSDTLGIISNDLSSGLINVTLSGYLNSNAPYPPVQISPPKGSKNTLKDITFIWTPSTDPDGGVVTYELYYTTDSDYQLNGFSNVPPIQAKYKGNTPMYARAATVPVGMLLIVGMALASPISRRRRAVLMLIVLAMLVYGLAACGNGLFGSDSSPVVTPSTDITYEVKGLAPMTKYWWKVVAVDDTLLKTDSEEWYFQTSL